MSDATKLQEMVDSYPDQIQQMEDSITELTAIAADLQEQREAIENVVLAQATTDSDAYLEAKKIELGGDNIVKGASYGVSDIINWKIQKTTTTTIPNPTPPPAFITVPTTVTLLQGSDLDGTGSQADQDQYERQNDFVEAYDHIWKAVDETGTYGIKGTRDNVNTGKGIVEINKAKIEDVLDVYQKYLQEEGNG